MKNKLALFGELVLVIAGVFVFRGLWMILDSIECMHTPRALWMSLIFGIAATVWAIHCIAKHEGKQ